MPGREEALLVGRSAELAILSRTIDEAAEGAGRAAGLTGPVLGDRPKFATRKSNKEIGEALRISARTVSTHLSNIFLKLSVGS